MQECFNKYSAAVIITGRVHPGESPSSWIMRGTTIVKPKSKSEVPNPKSKVQRKETWTGADNKILQAYRRSLTFLDLPCPSMIFHDFLWPFI